MLSNLSPSHVKIRAWCWALVVAPLVVLLTACGSNTRGSGTSQNTTPTASGSGYSGGRYGGGGTTPTASSSGKLIKTATATVKGTSQTILATPPHMASSYRTSYMPPPT